MSVEVILDTINSGYNTSKINSNFVAIRNALNDAVSRSGNNPNDMDADIDLDGNDILNGGVVSAERLIVDGEEILPGLISVKGDKGDQGDPGPQGPQGASGAGSGDMLAAQNLNDVLSKPTAFDNIKQAANDTTSGVVELATSAETIAGTSNTLVPSVAATKAFYDRMNMGKVFDYTGDESDIPQYHILPYGQAISRTTYSAYYAKVGTTYGVGDGSTTFNVPDLRGRVVAGKDNMGGSAASRLVTGLLNGISGLILGAVGGLDRHILLLAELASHTHSTTISRPSRFGANNGGVNSYWSAGDSNAGTATATFTSSSVGSNTAHNNVQPTMVLNKILYVGV